MTIQLVDLSNIVSIVLGSMTGVLAGFQIVRNLFLDRLVKGRLDATQQNTLYHLLIWLIIAGLVVGQAWLHGYTVNAVLAASALVAAWPIQQGVNLIFNSVQQIKVSSGQQMTMATLAPAMSAPATDPFAPLSLPPVPDGGAPDDEPPSPPEPPAEPPAAAA